MVGAGLVIFDLDGVLVDSEVVVAEIEARLLAEVGVPLTPQDLTDCFVGLSERDMTDRIFEDWGVTLDAAFHARKRRLVEEALCRSVAPVAGIADVLSGLTRECCVASSSRPERIRLSLERTGLSGWFGSRLFSASEVERGKPAPDLFLRAASALRTDPAECLVVEDSPYGVRAGVAAGMGVVGFTAGSHCGPGTAARLRQAGAPVVVGTSSELAEVLATPSSN